MFAFVLLEFLCGFMLWKAFFVRAIKVTTHAK